MRVGVYVDGFNLYYGGRSLCGRGTSGWRWLDIRSLATSLANWKGCAVHRVVYCTAPIDPASNRSGHADQQVYLRALVASGSVDHIEKGYYVSRVRTAPLATADAKGRPVMTTSSWPVMVADSADCPVPDANFLVSYARREEKATDVNLATLLLLDVLSDGVDAVVVISNDSDLRLPLREARCRVPVGTVNPSAGHLAGALRGTDDEGAGRHWWRQLTAADLRSHQLPDPACGYHRPDDW